MRPIIEICFKDSLKKSLKYPAISLMMKLASLFAAQPRYLTGMLQPFAGENCQLLRMMDDLTDIFITPRLSQRRSLTYTVWLVLDFKGTFSVSVQTSENCLDFVHVTDKISNLVKSTKLQPKTVQIRLNLPHCGIQLLQHSSTFLRQNFKLINHRYSVDRILRCSNRAAAKQIFSVGFKFLSPLAFDPQRLSSHDFHENKIDVNESFTHKTLNE